MREFDPVVISCAVTGAIHTPSMSPHLPVTPGEVAAEAVAAAEAGAAIVHVHVRDPETGEPSQDTDLFREVAERIRESCDAVVQPTTGGPPGMAVEERIRVVPALEPEMASCNMGSMNFGIYPLLDRYDVEAEWEREHLEGSRDYVFRNTFADLETLLPVFEEHRTVPELECYDVGHLYNAKSLVEKGVIETPIHVQFVMGIHGGIGADPENLDHMVRICEKLFGEDYSFSVIGAGAAEFRLGAQAVSMGGNVRVGLEDNLYLERGELAESNADLVERAARHAYELTGREPATPAEVRGFFDLKGAGATAF